MTEKEKELENLFKELHAKPDDLDEKIFLKVLEETHETKSSETFQTKPIPWNRIGVGLFALVLIGIIYSYLELKEENILIWVISVAVFIPVIIDKLLNQLKSTF